MEIYLQGLTMGLAYVAPIGLQNLFVINSALTQPRRRALLTALIVVFFDVTLALACFFGIGALMERFTWLQLIILLAGGATVVWIGVGLLRDKPTMDQMKQIWAEFKGRAQELELPTAPKQFLNYFEEDNRPQAKLDRDLEGGMAISVGRLRPDTQYDYKFVSLSHNTLRGAAGGGVLLAELLCAEGYIDHKI